MSIYRHSHYDCFDPYHYICSNCSFCVESDRCNTCHDCNSVACDSCAIYDNKKIIVCKICASLNEYDQYIQTYAKFIWERQTFTHIDYKKEENVKEINEEVENDFETVVSKKVARSKGRNKKTKANVYVIE